MAKITGIDDRQKLLGIAKLSCQAALLVFSLCWLAGCAATKTPPTPIVQPIIATPLPTTPPVVPALSSSTSVPATATPARAALPTPTLDGQERSQMTQQLIQAAEAGDTTTVQRLLQEGADINGIDELGRTPMMAATHGNHAETVHALIQAGADVDIRDNRLDNPFLYAGAEGLMEILQLTIAAGADTKLTNRYGGTALIPAAERGHVEIVAELLARTDVDINHVNNLGWTALLEAIILGDGGQRHTEVVRLLVEAGADVAQADSQGVSPLEHARSRGFAEITAILESAHTQ